MTILRVALVVFLLWVLFSARFPEPTPVADEGTETISATPNAPCPNSAPDSRLG
jgi:hypothetical protein